MTTLVQEFFQRYAAALLSFSAEAISSYYQTPLAIYANNGVRFVEDSSETLSFWKEGIKPYAAMGVKETKPDIVSEEKLSDTFFISKVHWTNYNDAGEAVGQETNFYILSPTVDGLKISGLVLL